MNERTERRGQGRPRPGGGRGRRFRRGDSQQLALPRPLLDVEPRNVGGCRSPPFQGRQKAREARHVGRQTERLLLLKQIVERLRTVDDENSPRRVRRPAQLGEQTLGAGEFGRRTVERREIRPEVGAAESESRREGERDKRRAEEGNRKPPCGRRLLRRGGLRLRGIRIGDKHEEKRREQTRTEEDRRLAEHGKRSDHQRQKADFRRDERDGEIPDDDGSAPRRLHQPVERIVDDEAEKRRAEDDGHQVDGAEAEGERESARERGHAERQREKRNPPHGTEDEDREKDDEGEREDRQPPDFGLAPTGGKRGMDRHPARRDAHTRRRGGGNARVEPRLEGDERVRVAHERGLQFQHHQDVRFAVALGAENAALRHPPGDGRRERRRETVQQTERVEFGRKERRNRRGIEPPRRSVRHAGAPRRRREAGQGRLRHQTRTRIAVEVEHVPESAPVEAKAHVRAVIRRQVAIEPFRRAHGGFGIRRGDDNRHKVGGLRAHGFRNRPPRCPDEVVERSLHGERTHQQNAAEQPEQNRRNQNPRPQPTVLHG